MRPVAFHPEARDEFFAAARHYESHAHGLGLAFIDAVGSTCRRLTILPEIGRPFGSRLRRVLVPGFPYGVVYRARPNGILVVAVAHVRRRPGYWKPRE